MSFLQDPWSLDRHPNTYRGLNSDLKIKFNRGQHLEFEMDGETYVGRFEKKYDTFSVGSYYRLSFADSSDIDLATEMVKFKPTSKDLSPSAPP
ncbi:hypothetical protein CVT25_001919 [Psilocybe cyanescens]|uniref:Uncharacterized protein n=1 Tax=Psilocybe cyanescens TaxID=93625 RepID=A0A409WQL0_PSICY|nr:hypothetical protein CVT25_001919 [Psilocybe cyanescens]